MGTITIIGTGWERGQLTLGAAEAFKSAGKVILHTERCGCAEWLRAQGVGYESLDALYDESEDFDAHVEAAAAKRLSCLLKNFVHVVFSFGWAAPTMSRAHGKP